MQGEIGKRFVFTEKRGSQSGFTLLEMLFSLSVFMVIVFYFPILFSFIQKEDNSKILETEIMFQQMNKDIRESSDLVVTSTGLLLLKPNGNQVTFEKYKTLIRRRVNNNGHEVLLEGIRDVSFSIVNNGVVITLLKENGERMARRLSLISKSWRYEG